MFDAQNDNFLFYSRFKPNMRPSFQKIVSIDCNHLLYYWGDYF